MAFIFWKMTEKKEENIIAIHNRSMKNQGAIHPYTNHVHLQNWKRLLNKSLLRLVLLPLLENQTSY